MPTFSVRFTDEQLETIRTVASARGFSTTNAFIRNAVEREIQNHGASQTVAEEAKRIDDSLQTILVWLDCLTKAFFLRVAEPPDELADLFVDQARRSHMNFRRRVAKEVGLRNAPDAQFSQANNTLRGAAIPDRTAEAKASDGPFQPMEDGNDETAEEGYSQDTGH